MKVSTDVQVFSMPHFFGSEEVIVVRAVAMFLFGLMLARYIGKRKAELGFSPTFCFCRVLRVADCVEAVGRLV